MRAEPKTPADFAQVNFSDGNDHGAFQLLNLDAIVGGGTLKDLGWVTGLRRMATGVHFGVGIQYSGSRAVKSPEPIGGGGGGDPTGTGAVMTPSPGPQPGGVGRGRNPQGRQQGRGGYGLAGQPQTGQPREKPELFKAPEDATAMLSFFTGELGEKLVSGLASRISKGSFGQSLATAAKGSADFGSASDGLAGNFPGAVPAGVPSLPPGAVTAPLPANPGALPGPGLPGAAGAGRGKGNQLAPAITMLGESNRQAELLDRARKQNIDVLFIFEMEVSAVGENVINKTKIVAFNMGAGERGEVGHTSKTLINNAVAKAREGRGEDPVDGEMTKLFTYLDDTFQFKSLPATATPEKVDKLVSTYVGRKFADPLPTLAELRYYYDRKLITTEKLAEVAKAVAGDDAGEAVASGNGDRILTSLGKWLPEKRPKTIAVEGAGGAAAGSSGSGVGGFLNKLLGGGKK